MNILPPDWLDSRFAYAAAAFAAYTFLCHTLRFRRIRNLERKYGFGSPKRPGYGDMTDKEAFEIQKEISEAEFPSLFEKGLQLALFRTYGIPSISKLLVQTAQLSTSENVGKRYADTAVIIVEIYGSEPSGEKGIEAFARLNFLHGHYLKQGRITNDDMLYTLALFMNHPCEWIAKYEWRKLTDMEVCAVATFHKSMGDAMQISYDVLPGSKAGWKDGLHFYKELDEWAKAYEKKFMLPHQDNYLTAKKTEDLLLSTVPTFTHGLVSQLVTAAMDDRLREAIKFTSASDLAKFGFNSFMSIRRFFLRHLALPRWQRDKRLSDETADGHRYVKLWTTTPHYVKPTTWNRWGPPGLFQLMIGAPRPGDTGMHPEGYRRPELGPRAFAGKGQKEFDQEKQRISQSRTGGCPFVSIQS